MRTIRIATRKSPLALWQAEYVAAKIKTIHTDIHVELLPMVTEGDRVLGTPLAAIGGKGLFIKELEQAMLDDRADIAVHSMKDVPMDLPEGMCIAAICEREDPNDAFVSKHFDDIADLPNGARVGTSSLRRRSQLLAYRPDLQIEDLRGNVNTRLRKLDDGEFDAIILAAAGLKRLQMADRIRSTLTLDICLPAVGQGAVGIEIRQSDSELATLLSPLNHEQTAHCVRSERAMSRRLQGSCQVPIAGHAEWQAGRLKLLGLVADLTGSTLLKVQMTNSADKADQLGGEVADELLRQGAGEILAAIG